MIRIKDICKSIVPLEKCTDPPSFVGTGFILMYEVEDFCVPVLFSCKHIVENSNIQYRWNVAGEISRGIIGKPVGPSQLSFDWVYHSDDSIDIAAAIIQTHYRSGIPHRLIGFGLEKIKSVGEDDLGDKISYFGFPLGTGASIDQPHLPLVRSGIISQISENNSFIVEANVFPGSSGSPVLQNAETDPKIIGIITSYIPYRDTAISAQTDRPRIIFEENSGLALVIKSEYITDLINSDEFQEKAAPIIQYIKKEVAGNLR